MKVSRSKTEYMCVNEREGSGTVRLQGEEVKKVQEYLGSTVQSNGECGKEDVEDTSPNRCATSFKVLVVSPQFEGKPLLQRHRMVNTCLATELKEIHAFEQKTLTPE
ncbi:hypothetical protein QTP70_026289, partial [Hemibagrus guttatus]